MAYQETLPDAETRLRVGAIYEDYHRDSFDDDLSLTLEGFGEWYLEPRLFSWVVTDSFRKVQISPTGPNTPENLEDSNVLTTGPNVYFHINERDSLLLEGRLGDVYIADTDLDNRRKFGALRWIHQTSSRTRLAANYEYMGVTFKETGTGQDYSRSDAFVTATYMTDRTEFRGEAGVTRADMEDGESLRGNRGRIALAQQLSSYSRAGIQYFQEYSDTGLELLATGITSAPGEIGRTGNVAFDVISGDLFYNKQAEIFYRRTGSSVPWGIRLFGRDVDFTSTSGDRRESGGVIDINYTPFVVTTIAVFSFYRATDYLDSEREDRDLESGFAMMWQLGRRLSARLEYRYISRESSVADAGFADSRVTASLGYGTSPLSAGPTASMIR